MKAVAPSSEDGAASGVVVKRKPRYSPETARDVVFFMGNLARVQPASWNRLRRRLPKRRPRYWAFMREQLIVHGNVREFAGNLSIARVLDSEAT